MTRSTIRTASIAVALAASAFLGVSPSFAQSVMQQCGQQYQAAKAANTLNGMSWNQYRTECSARLKAAPASAPAAAPVAAPAAPVVANPLKPVAAPVAAAPTPAAPTTAAVTPASATPPAPAATTAAGKPMSPGRVAFVARERQCGTEWKANKVSLVAATPGLTWPKYLSACNTRLKAAGQ